MDELVAWLREQLAADERGDGFAHCRGCEGGGVEFMGTMYECDIDSARARVLREVESKQDMLDACERQLYDGTSGDALAQQIIPLLALPYADREGYQASWRP